MRKLNTLEKTTRKIDTGYKLGLYIRASTEEQSSAKNPEGTIKNQEMRLRDMARVKGLGDNINLFVDEGISAKNTKRPELQRLLKAIKDKKINMVMVTEYSRLSRNMRDFAQMWEMFKDEGCGIISIREQFDTSTAAGEMMLYNMANLAQFERRLTAERVKASRIDRAARGLYNGGVIPLGYKVGSKPGYLEVDSEEKGIIKMAFKAFLKEGTLGRAARWLNDNNYRPPKRIRGGKARARIGHFVIGNIRKILTNKMYVGIVEYEKEGERIEAKAVWKPIVDRVTFDKVQEIIKSNHRNNRPAKACKHPYILSGITFCAKCNESMCGKSAHGSGGKYSYYEHSWSVRKNSCLSKKVLECEMHRRVSAVKLEEIVEREILKLITSEKHVNSMINEAAKIYKSTYSSGAVIKSISKDISSFKAQALSVTERLGKLPSDVPADSFYQLLRELNQKKKNAETLLAKAKKDRSFGHDEPAELDEYRLFLLKVGQLWKDGSIDPDLKSRIVKLLISKIEIDKIRVTIHYFMGKSNICRELENGSLLCEIENSEGRKSFLKNIGSRPCHNGAPERT